MCKKFIFLFFVLAVFIVLPTFPQQQQVESITITTYYPAPFGVYQNLRLYPSDEPTETPCQEGTMYYDKTDNQVKVCGCCDADGKPFWQGVGLWTRKGNDVYLADTNWNVGIGTTTPQEKLNVAGKVRIGAYTLPDTDGTNGQTLVTDGSGAVNWASGEAKIYSVVSRADTSTDSTSWVAIDGMTIEDNFPAGKAYIHYNAGHRDDTGAYTQIRIKVDGNPLIQTPTMNMTGNTGYLGTDGSNGFMTDLVAVTDLSAGQHTITLEWKVIASVHHYTYQEGATSPRSLIIIAGLN